MAPLYKRYIPPDDQIRRQKEPESTVGLGIKIDGQEVRPGKRKRDEQQQVKARKARKADRSENTETTNDIEREGLEDTLNDGTVEQELQSLATQDGSFAHIKSSKKRHKLEKEARKARKLATLSRDNTVNDSIPQNTESPVHAAVHPVVAASKALQNAVGQRQPSEELNMSGTEECGDGKNPSAGDSGIAHTQETKQDVEDEDISDHDEAYLKKHASILGKFAKSKQRSDKIQAEKNGDDQDDADTERPVIKDLTPFGVELEDEKPRVAMSALPEWLARPTLVTQTTNKSFRELGLSDETSRHLAECGFAEALPVQQALLPDLLPTGSPGARFPPGTETILPDIAVSAPTGSGKTLAYLLPLIESLKKQPSSRGIAALIIVPTRELATQVAAVAVQLAKGSKITTGIACGGNKLADEQKRLMKISYEYDPSAYNEAVQALFSIQNPPLEENVEEMDEYMTTIDEKLEQKQYFLDTLNGRSGHVPRYDATFDVLVCTPGRLFEHLANTNGFNLSDVRWLVLDEADKLLDEQYHGLLDTLNEELAKERPIWMRGPRENHLRNHSLWNDAQERAVRKVVLSATMTKDVSKLAGLQLKRPKLVVIGTREQETGLNASKANTSDQRGEIFELPTGLQEYYCPVGLGEQKPVQLLHLIETRVLVDHGRSSNQSMQIDNGSTMSSDSDSDSESSSDSEGSDSASSGSGESDSDSDIDSSNASITSIDSVDEVSVTAKKNDSITQNGSVSSIMPTILIFTASTEAALRLTQLLKTLRPDMSSSIRSITKTNNGNALTSLATGKPCIVVATDRAGRGLDTIAGRHITHVIQYDVPRSIVMYVHRVGRTARAGREGQAWTLYTRSQARWFIKEVLNAPSIQRAANVRKVMIEELDEEMLRRYEKALEGLRKQVFAKKP